MDRSKRIFLLLVFIVIAAWRLVRYLSVGMGKPRRSLGVTGGWVPSSSGSAKPDISCPASTVSSDPFPTRTVGLAVTVLIWLVGHFAIWVSLFELPLLQNAPPALLGMAGIVANFYLIPVARHAGGALQGSDQDRAN